MVRLRSGFRVALHDAVFLEVSMHEYEWLSVSTVAHTGMRAPSLPCLQKIVVTEVIAPFFREAAAGVFNRLSFFREDNTICT